MKKLAVGLLMLVGMLVSAQDVVRIRDLSGIDCAARSDSSTALQTACSNISGKRLSMDGCSYLRLDHPVQCFANSSFDIGNSSHSATQLLGCGGSRGQALITFQRSGHGRIHGLSIYPNGGSWCGSNLGQYTTDLLLDNDFVGHPGGYTTTDLTIEDMVFQGNVANWIGLGTTSAQNLEYLRIWNNYFYGSGTNSADISILSGNSQGDDIYHNSFGGAYYGIRINGPQFIIRNNVIDAGDSAVYGAGGAAIYCIGGLGPSTIEDNSANEGSGSFFKNGSPGCGSNGGPVTFSRNLIGGESGHVFSPSYMIDVGGGGNYVFRDNYGGNANGARPIIGSSTSPYDNVGGWSGSIRDEGNRWTTKVYDDKGPTHGIRSQTFSPNVFEQSVSPDNGQDVTNATELQARPTGGNGDGTENPPMKIWRSGPPGLGSYVDYAIGVLDDVFSQSSNGNSLILGAVIRNDPAQPTSVVIQQPLMGGIKMVATPALAALQANCQGGGSGSTWGYKVSCTSGGGTTYTTSEVTQSCSKTLDSAHRVGVVIKKSPGYTDCGLWLTTDPSGLRTLGKIGKFNTLNPTRPCTTLDVGQGCAGSDQRWYMTDKGQATITAGSPPTTNADGRVTAAGGVQPASTGGLMTWFQVAKHASLDLDSVANGACSAENSESIPGAALGDSCSVAAGTALEAGGFLRCAVTAPGTVKWQFCNLSGGAINRTSDTYTIRVIR
jgi:hypothetical protein